MARTRKTLTEEEIREDTVPEGAGTEVPKTPGTPEQKELEQPQEPKKEHPPKDYVKKALELIREQREGDGSQELFVVEQNLVEALRFIEKHEKKGGA